MFWGSKGSNGKRLLYSQFQITEIISFVIIKAIGKGDKDTGLGIGRPNLEFFFCHLKTFSYNAIHERSCDDENK